MAINKKEFDAARDAFDPLAPESVARWQAIMDRVLSDGVALHGGPEVKSLRLAEPAKPAKIEPKIDDQNNATKFVGVEIKDLKP